MFISCGAAWSNFGGMNRRAFLQLASISMPLLASQDAHDPWKPSELIQPLDLANRLRQPPSSLEVICVAFPVLYRQRHIAGAILAGPGSKPEGVADLKSALKNLKPDDEVILYCGCCPMQQCPNIRPAYSTAKELGFSKVRILDLPNNFHKDWTAKGYPTS